jgi:hypothetical protein
MLKIFYCLKTTLNKLWVYGLVIFLRKFLMSLKGRALGQLAPETTGY